MFRKAFNRIFTSTGIGPGGWKCNCCSPAPGKEKKKWMRKGKKNMNKFFTKFIQEQLTE